VEPWLEGVTSAIDKQIKIIKSMPSDSIKEMLTPVLIEEPDEKEELDKKDSKLDQITTNAKVVGGRFLVKQDKRQVIEIEIQTEKPISHEIIDVGSSLSIYPQNSESEVDQII
jgi:sulfite reductase alpha subunit-like flavoprotein